MRELTSAPGLTRILSGEWAIPKAVAVQSDNDRDQHLTDVRQIFGASYVAVQGDRWISRLPLICGEQLVEWVEFGSGPGVGAGAVDVALRGEHGNLSF